MAKVGFYLTDEELAYVKTKPKGWLRRLVQHQMSLFVGKGENVEMKK